MIGRIRGQLIEKTTSQVVVDVAGLGYEIDIPLSTFYDLGETGNEVVLYTHFVVRDDAQLLFGFLSHGEREMFRLLIRINGVGPKLAITILSGLDAAALSQCVHGNDVKALTALPGVGKKTAERLIVEMRDRIPEPATLQMNQPKTDALADAEAALIELGFKPQEASRALANAPADDQSVEDLIRHGLKNLT